MKVRGKAKEPEEGTRLVRLVKEYPCLYNYNLPEYSQREVVEDAWKRIAEKLKSDPKVIRDKWRNYRTVFLRRCKAQKQGGGRSSSSSYYLMDELNFLLDFVKISVPLKCRSTTNTNDVTVSDGYTIFMPSEVAIQKTDLEEFQENIEYDSETSVEYASAAAPKQQLHIPAAAPQRPPPESSKVIELYNSTTNAAGIPQKTATETTNPRTLFFMSISPELDKMTDKQFRQFRRMCLNFIDECEDDE